MNIFGISYVKILPKYTANRPKFVQFKKYFSWNMPRISLTSRHATRPNSKKKLSSPPPPPHNTTHKNTRHIGLHHNTPYHNTTTTFVPHTTYITPQQNRTSHHTTTHDKVATFILYTLEQIFEDKALYLMQNTLIRFIHAFL